VSRPLETRDDRWDAAGYGLNARFVADLGGDILAWAAPEPGMRVLDLGCGDGALTRRLIEAGAVVTGADSSPSMVEAASAAGLDVRQASGEALEFGPEFDLVFSNAALHWMTDAYAVSRGVFAALKPGGRFVAEMGGHGNVAAIATALRAAARKYGVDEAAAMPWYFPTPAEHAACLERAGFAVRRISLHPRPTPLPTGMEAWLATFQTPFFDLFGAGRRDGAIAFVTDLLRPSLADGDGHWTGDYVRLRFEAAKP
jgi:SAM-dependent methyltransferase